MALLFRAVLLASLPCLVLIYTLLFKSTPRGPLPEPTASGGHPSWPDKRPHSNRVILVTGAAGFVGFHVSRELVDVRGWGAMVIGLDNFNDYYDVQLKKDRTSELVKAGARVYNGDLCDRPFLHYLFGRYNFTDVVHMAAQAGVRHSLTDPLAYVHTNIQCYLTLLDVLKENRHTSLIYASSSSVYGGSPLPFSSHSPPHPPTNMYAAVKTSNEQFALAYCSQYGLQAVGLRLFTVYGPWGRPDMAVYKFAENIVTGKPVPLFGHGSALWRDFTYISDTVGGVILALDHTPSHCGEVYNLAYGQPVAMETMLKYLEAELQQKAILEYLPLPPSDLHSTHADISDTKTALNFHPNVSLKEGIRLFVSWFRDYHDGRRSWEESGRTEERNQLLDFSLGLGEEEQRGSQLEDRDQRNDKYRNRISQLREKYVTYARENGIPLPVLKKTAFVFYPGVESPGSTVIKAPGYRGNIQMLEERCRQTEQCLAFTTEGEFKNQLRPRELWKNTSSAHGMYVADIDICAADLHDCDRHSSCYSTGPARHDCICHVGYLKLGKYCVERYEEGEEGEGEGVWRLSDEMDGRDWNQLTEGRPFIFFQGLDSPGGDYMVVEGGGGDVVRLEEVCRGTYRCIAFNTNGILKHSLRPPTKWPRWTDHPSHGLYVLDVDYCALDPEQCPPHSLCVRHSPGNYSCVCEEGWRMTGDYRCQGKDSLLAHVILSVDRAHLLGLVTVMHSILQHTADPGGVAFHVVVAGIGREELRGFLHCYGFSDLDQVEIVELDESWLEGQIHVYSQVEDVGNLASMANFARFYFPRLFPQLTRAIYVDVDTVVVGEIQEFWEKLQMTEQLLLAVPRPSPSYGSMFTGKVKQLFQERYGQSFADSDPTFNAGVYGVNLDLWRKKDVHLEVVFWMEQHAREPLWRFGTQPIMLLAAYRQWEWLEQQWNVNGLGWNDHMSENLLTTAKLLHWSGRRKPWLSDGLYSELWLPHHPSACGGHGKCERDGGGWRCQCEGVYTGEQCQNKVDR